MDFSERVKTARAALGLTRAEAAVRAGMAPSTLGYWESGQDVDRVQSGMLRRYAVALGVSLDWLLTGNGHGPEPAQGAVDGPQSPGEANHG